MLGGQIKPIVKNNCLGKIDSSNYRPVMSSFNLLQIFQYCLQPFLLNHLKYDNRQFGFRSKTSCVSAVLNSNVQNSNVHCTVVDISTAFDRIHHSILMNKLRATSFLLQIINMLEYI